MPHNSNSKMNTLSFKLSDQKPAALTTVKKQMSGFKSNLSTAADPHSGEKSTFSGMKPRGGVRFDSDEEDDDLFCRNLNEEGAFNATKLEFTGIGSGLLSTPL